MNEIENAERTKVVETAKSWLNTPYHHMGRKKGVGADCLTYIAEVFEEAGLVPNIKIPYYPADWHLHQGAERYFNGLLDHVHLIEGTPKPGDIALWRFGRCFSHGAIVIQWPIIIHAYLNSSIKYEDVSKARWLSSLGTQPRPCKFFSFWS